MDVVRKTCVHASGARIGGGILHALGAAARQMPHPCYAQSGRMPCATPVSGVGAPLGGVGISGAHFADFIYERAEIDISTNFPLSLRRGRRVGGWVGAGPATGWRRLRIWAAPPCTPYAPTRAK